MIKNMMFDLGGVIMNIDRNRCAEAFKKLGFKNVDEFLGDYGQKGAFALLESGKITAVEFREEVRKNIESDVSDKQIDDAFQQFLLGIPAYRLRQLTLLRNKYKIYLLSNTNPIMWNDFICKAFTIEGKSREDYFDGMVTSFEAKCMKPAAQIFDLCAKQFGILPEETLFFDDSLENCKASEVCGYKSAYVAPGTEFFDILLKRGIYECHHRKQRR